MGKPGDGYGSEDHLRFYRRSSHAAVLDRAILSAIHLSNGATIRWTYPPAADAPLSSEPEGIDFLGRGTPALSQWRKFWPQRGTQPSWDGVAQVEPDATHGDWLLLEAKA